MRQVIGVDVGDEGVDVGGHAVRVLGRLPAVERQGPVIEHHAPAAHDAAHAQVHVQLALKARQLAVDLRQQRAADDAGTDHADRQRVRRQVEGRVHGAQRARGLPGVDHDRDVALGGALGDGADVDRGIGERREELAGNARRAGHAVADHGEDGAAAGHRHALDLPFAQLGLEGPAHDLLGAARLALGHGKADRVLARGLADQDDRDAGIAQRTEQALGGARHADHAGALEVEERDVVDGRDALDRELRARGGRDHGTGLGRRERVLDPDRDLPAHGRGHGLRVDDLGAEIGQFHRLVVGQRIDDLGVRHAPRVGRQHAVDVGPDDDLLGIEQRAEDRARVVAAVAAERGRHAAGIGGDEAGDDEHALEIGRDPCREPRRGGRPLHDRSERAPLDDQHLAGVQPLHRAPDLAATGKHRGEQARRPDFAVAGDHVADGLRRRAHEAHGVQHAEDVLAVGLQLRDIAVSLGAAEHGAGDRRVPLDQGIDTGPVGVVVRLGGGDQRQQRVGDAAAGREDDTAHRMRVGFDDRGHPMEAVGVGDGGAAELVDYTAGLTGIRVRRHAQFLGVPVVRRTM